MKKIRKLFALVLCMALVTLLVSTTAEAAVKISKASLTIVEGNTATLKITGTKNKVTWTTSSKSIATVSSKGVVTGKKPGKATVTATVNKKKYTCKITVVEQFNATKASKNIKSDLVDTGEGVIAILKNNNKYPISLDATMVYMDASGTVIGKAESYNYYFESGKECSLKFSAPYDSKYNKVEYSTYKITYKITSMSDSIKSALSDISIESNIGVDNVMVNVQNKGNKSPSSTIISIVYYKDGVVIGHDYQYAEVDSPGAEDYLEFSFPYDMNYETLEIDDYKVFVNSSYFYTWE